MPTQPREWRFFGDPPPSESVPDQAPLEGAFDNAFADGLEPSVGGTTGQTAQGRLLRQLPATPLLVAVGGTALGLLVLLFVAVALVAAPGRSDGVVIADRATGIDSVVGSSAPPAAASGLAPALVDVEGAVVSPGLLHVPPGSRVGDAITAAGGYSAAVDLGAAAAQLNLAAPLADGDKVHVPSLAERIAGAPGSPLPDGASTHAATSMVDLNHADQASLESLPGIGPVTASKIITARATQPFASLDDAQSRKVLSASVVEQIRPLATVTP